MPDGWKTLTAGGIAIATGIFIIVWDPAKFEVGIGFISAGLATIGIGHKIEKAGK